MNPLLSLCASIIGCGIVVYIVCFFLFGRTPNRQYRTSYTRLNTDQQNTVGADAVIEVTHDYKLGFVEFDDQGWFWDRRQLDAVKQMVEEEIGTGRPVAPEGIVLIVFVHGWKNNASYTNENVQIVREALKGLNATEQIESQMEKRMARKVVGVYAGWRGKSARWEPFKECSFWGRKNTAHKVGHQGALTELLVSLENLQESGNSAIPDGAPRTELIIIGHSFGGASVYSAVSQMITERFIDSVEYHAQPIKPLGDEVILLNPAFEASQHYNLNELATRISHYPENQRPVLAIFTSRTDQATGFWFPIGEFFPEIFQRHRGDKHQRAAGLKAVGWFKPFITHTLNYDARDKVGATAAEGSVNHTTINPETNKHEKHTTEKLTASIVNLHDQRRKWHPNGDKPMTYSFDDCELKPRENFRPGDPFFVVSVDKRIMNGHNDIANPVLLNFLREFILFCKTKPGESLA